MSSGPAALLTAVLRGLPVSPGARLWAEAHHHCLLGLILRLDCLLVLSSPVCPTAPHLCFIWTKGTLWPLYSPHTAPMQPTSELRIGTYQCSHMLCSQVSSSPTPDIEVSILVPHLRVEAFCSHPSAMGKVSTETVAVALIEIVHPTLIKC